VNWTYDDILLAGAPPGWVDNLKTGWVIWLKIQASKWVISLKIHTKGLIPHRRANELRDRLTADRTIMGNLTEYQVQFENTLAIGIKVLSVTGKLLRESKKERVTHGLMVGDSLHLCNMNRCAAHICDIVTHDGDFNHVADIVVWEPMDVV